MSASWYLDPTANPAPGYIWTGYRWVKPGGDPDCKHPLWYWSGPKSVQLRICNYCDAPLRKIGERRKATYLAEIA